MTNVVRRGGEKRAGRKFRQGSASRDCHAPVFGRDGDNKKITQNLAGKREGFADPEQKLRRWKRNHARRKEKEKAPRELRGSPENRPQGGYPCQPVIERGRKKKESPEEDVSKCARSRKSRKVEGGGRPLMFFIGKAECVWIMSH